MPWLLTTEPINEILFKHTLEKDGQMDQKKLDLIREAAPVAKANGALK